MDYCMWLDADDVFLEEDQKGFSQPKELWTNCLGGHGPYHTGFDERGRVTFSYYREG